MSEKKEKILSKYDISETVYNTGIENFLENDMNEWIGKDSITFFEKYIHDADNKIIRSEDTLELYYKGIELEGNFKEKNNDFIINDDGKKIGRIEISRVPLYEKKTDKKIGIAHWKCIENISESNIFVECKLVYFLDSNFIPEHIRESDNSIFTSDTVSTLSFDFNYLSKPGLGNSFSEGDYFVSKGYYSLENGLNRTQAINNIYLPVNSPDKKRSIVIYFNKLDSNNFLPQNNYGVGSMFSFINKNKI